jgi:hypothetical protein
MDTVPDQIDRSKQLHAMKRWLREQNSSSLPVGCRPKANQEHIKGHYEHKLPNG